MKLLTIAIPCYQSQDYLRRCVEPLLDSGDEVEILIIDDGSTDATGDIAKEIQAAHPHMVRVIRQENQGHGGAVMTGLHNAAGVYFKVVDSDDWLDKKALDTVLANLRALDRSQAQADMVLCNYVYEKAGVKHKRVVRYGSVFPQGTLCTWADAGRFRLGEYILMHSVIFRTALLLESGLDLPQHTFYVDNLFVYQPMPGVRTILYLDVDLYHYFIGRADQSVNEGVMIGRIDQQLRINLLMLGCVDLQSVAPPQLQKSMCRYMEIVTVVSTILLFRDGRPESLEKKKALWREIRATDPWFYGYLTRKTMLGFGLKHNGWLCRKTALLVYRISRWIIGFS